jgi:triacylglycerol lipase
LDALEDFDFDMIDFEMIPNAGNTEHGFTRFYESLSFVDPIFGDSQNVENYLKGLPQTISFTVAGYSLGGAMATLHVMVLAYQNIPVEVYTFASPMVGNAEFVKMYNTLVHNTYRIVNIPDIVPRLPSAFFDYQHVTDPFLIDSRKYPKIKRNIYSYHNLEVYIYTLGATNM